MVKAGGIFVCLLIVALDILAGILGIKAEIAQNEVCPPFDFSIKQKFSNKQTIYVYA